MTIPANMRVPWLYVQFDGSRAQQGATALRYKVLLVGNKLAGGSKAALEPVKITNKDQGALFFGKGSVLAGMVESFFKNNSLTSVEAIALDDHEDGVAATGKFTVTGTATESGVAPLYIGGKLLTVGITVGDTAAEVAAAISAAIQDAANASLIVSASVDAAEVTVTSKNKGAHGNSIDLRVGYHPEEVLPAGIAIAVTAMSGGVQNPEIASIFPVIGDEWYQHFVHPYLDNTNLNALRDEMADRWGPLRQIEGTGLTASRGSFATNTTLGEGRNDKHSLIMDCLGPNNPWDWASAISGQVAPEAEADPALPFQNLVLVGILAPTKTERRNITERNQLLYSGISTHKVSDSGQVMIEMLITTYRKNEAGADDEAYLRYNTLAQLMYIRFDYRSTMLRKYPRHKLANDGTRIGPNQKVVTPSLAKAETLAMFRRWETMGIVEGGDQFKKDLSVVRSATNVDRLDTTMSPDLVNQFRVGGTTIAFLLQRG